MKKAFMLLIALLAGAPVLFAAPPVNVYAEASYDQNIIYLDIFADAAVPLRSFGLKVEYASDLMQPTQVGAFSHAWFLATAPGQTNAYTSATQESNAIRIVGARFDGTNPEEGVSGDRLLLGTIKFLRTSENLPETFGLFPSGPAKFAGFVSVAGDALDDSVVGFGEIAVVFGALPLDEDNDGLLDSYEMDQFGNLTEADGSTDTDQDGMTDADELYAGTNPLDPDDATKLSISSGNDGMTVEWSGKSGRFYDLLWTDNLTEEFLPLAVGIPPSALQSFLDDTPLDQGYYRLDIHNPSWH